MVKGTKNYDDKLIDFVLTRNGIRDSKQLEILTSVIKAWWKEFRRRQQNATTASSLPSSNTAPEELEMEMEEEG